MPSGCIWPPPKPPQSVVRSEVPTQLQATRVIHQEDGVLENNTGGDVLINLSYGQTKTGDDQRLRNIGQKDTTLGNTEHTGEVCLGTNESVLIEFIQTPDQSQTYLAAESTNTQHRIHDTKHLDKKHVYLFGKNKYFIYLILYNCLDNPMAKAASAVAQTSRYWFKSKPTVKDFLSFISFHYLQLSLCPIAYQCAQSRL